MTNRLNDHTDRAPLLTMWYQARDAIADVIIPVLAGFKTIWLIIFASTKFFHAQFAESGAASVLRTPFDPIWRAFTKGLRKPLEPAQFLLLGILAKVLVREGLEAGSEAGVQAGVQAALKAQSMSALDAETAQVVEEVLEKSIEAGIQVANTEAVRAAVIEEQAVSAIAEPMNRAAPRLAGLDASSLDSLQSLLQSAVERGVDAANLQAIIERSSVDPAVIERIILSGIETGVQAGVEMNAAWTQSNSLMQLMVGRALQSLPPALLAKTSVVQTFYVTTIAPFLDQALVSAITDLMGYLFVVVIFAYLFRLLVRRRLSAAQSYTFWLYVESLNIFSIVSFLLIFQLFPLFILRIHQALSTFFQQVLDTSVASFLFTSPAIDSLNIAPDVATFWFLETGIHVFLWLYLLPALILPKLFPSLTIGRVFFASLLGRVIFLLLSALILFGLITGIAYMGIDLT